MKLKLQKKLYKTFPDLYRDHTKSPQETAMCWGFQLNGDGWYKLIYKLSKQITKYCKKNKISIPAVSTVKSKFGSLRFYMSIYYKEIETFIDEAERISSETCELCGDTKGKTHQINGWLWTLCIKHYKEIKKEKK
jgi:hypothetical protein